MVAVSDHNVDELGKLWSESRECPYNNIDRFLLHKSANGHDRASAGGPSTTYRLACSQRAEVITVDRRVDNGDSRGLNALVNEQLFRVAAYCDETVDPPQS